ncbi:MAG: IS200/IS605 family transposase [Balneolaceae bacterium]|nr:IS200/IS605 family transposase [Balneolaceae bacterium]
MPKTYACIWLHAVWSTKERQPVLHRSFRYRLFRHIKEYGQAKDIHGDIINGVKDHVHFLFRLRPAQSPSEVIKKIKGESSHWINENGFMDYQFAWQKGYGIFSVGEKDIKNVRVYIYNQENYHKYVSYREEINKLKL